MSAANRGEWARSFGPRWKLDLVVMGIVVFLFGAVRPLADPDLPMHLAVGEWIVRHRAVPLTEPFAWTRAGAPYYAYSWLPQSVFYLVLDQFGHLGLRALQGFVTLGSAAAAVVLARCAGWRPSQALILAGLNLIVAAFFVALLRPQGILLVTVPLVWAGVLGLANGRPRARMLLLMLAASALTANSHLFFPLTLAPVALLLARASVPRRDVLLAAAAVMAGWLVTPYALHWLEIYRHNFGFNYLYRPPSAITELQPGFVTLLYPAPGPMLALAGALLALPWLARDVALSDRERWMHASYWMAGVILFGYATRLFVAWWLLSMVATGLAIVRRTSATEDAPPRAPFRLLALVACLLIIAGEGARTRAAWSREGDTRRRSLPTHGALAVEPIASWLDTHVAGGSKARVMTTFPFGSYVSWRLPGYSASIDSRGVFPDSVSAAEAVVKASDRDVPIGPWGSADVAIVPLAYRAAAVLDTAAGWRRAITVPGDPVPQDSIGLWVRDGWYATRAVGGARR